MEAFTEGSLLAFLATVPDPRSRHGRRHPSSAHPLFSALRHHVRREELRGYRSMGSGPGHHADSPTPVHLPARQVWLSFTHISLLTEILTAINLAAIFNNTVHLFELSI